MWAREAPVKSIMVEVHTPRKIKNLKLDILVCGLEHVLFFHILGMSSSQLTKSYFSEG